MNTDQTEGRYTESPKITVLNKSKIPNNTFTKITIFKSLSSVDHDPASLG